MSGRLARRPFVGLARTPDHDAVLGAIARVGLSDRMRSPLGDLSGGQQQRVLIARALAGDADLLVMDEPTSGVDHDNQEALAELLGGLVNEGASVLLVAHELGPMRPLIDRAVVLHHGQVDYDGPVSGVTHEEHEQVHHHTEPPEPRPEVLGGEGVFR
jgi:zinc transport system ATP-binding protein